MKKRIISIILCLPMTLLSLTGCGKTAASEDLTKDIKAATVSTNTDINGEDKNSIADFAVRLFQSSMSNDQNSLVSPISVLYALSMTANGAKGETLTQMEDVLGLPIDELNTYLYSYMKALPESDDYKLSIANSIWFHDDESLTVNSDFLQTNANYYNAGIYKAAFDDTTLDDINTWVKDNTDGMIDKILDKISDDAIMYLVNALAFDAKWQEEYNADQVSNAVFNTESGEEQDTEMMYSDEHVYLEDDNTVGFLKYYKDNKYAFVALLPDEGTSIADYAATLTGDKIMNLLDSSQDVTVYASIPKFESDYSLDLAQALKDMGMPLAFDADYADFTGLGTSENGNIYIGRVLHKTFITVDELGTKAGAATVVEMLTEGCMIEEIKTVYLNRPFVYMLIDCETNLPLFIGTMMDLNE